MLHTHEHLVGVGCVVPAGRNSDLLGNEFGLWGAALAGGGADGEVLVEWKASCLADLLRSRSGDSRGKPVVGVGRRCSHVGSRPIVGRGGSKVGWRGFERGAEVGQQRNVVVVIIVVGVLGGGGLGADATIRRRAGCLLGLVGGARDGRTFLGLASSQICVLGQVDRNAEGDTIFGSKRAVVAMSGVRESDAIAEAKSAVGAKGGSFLGRRLAEIRRRCCGILGNGVISINGTLS